MNLKGFTDPRVLRRFIILMALLTFGGFTFWAVSGSYLQAPPGDYEVRQGDILFGDGKFDAALERFDVALEKSPDHRGALMGRALVYLQAERYIEAEAEFTYLIKFLKANLEPDDITGIAVYAAAYANRGTMYNRLGCRPGGTSQHFEKALADYIQALNIDEGAIEGPNLVDRIIYGTPRPSTIRLRAVYMVKQMALPEPERLLCVPEKDAEQRMYKPF
ncbi:MAG: tetratricopeptide repeat protein [Pseudomonadota bacterium]|nr:tetratricopeptide repeat protein [Pseudomonadota bacterium]